MTGKKTKQSTARRTGTILLLGNYRATIAVAGALKHAGYRVIAGLEGEPLGVECSRFVDAFWDHPKLTENSTGFLQALDDFLLAQADIVAVLPVTEEFALFLAEHEKVVKRHTVLASPSKRVIEMFTDKLAALSLARDHKVPTLPFARVADHASLLDEARKIGFPLTVRGLGATARLHGLKALIVNDMPALKAALPEWPSGHDGLLLQRYATGERRNVYFAAHNGRILGVAQSRITRTNAPDGTGLAVDGVTEHPDTLLESDTAKLLAATGYTGIGLAQFIVDSETGQRCFLELNPRVSGSHCVAERAGLPLSRMAIDLAKGEASRHAGSGTNPVVGQAGLRYAWTDGDLLAAKQALIRGDITLAEAASWTMQSLHTAIVADFQMVWNRRDPGPAIMSLLLVLPLCGRIRAALTHLCTRGRTILPWGGIRSEIAALANNETWTAPDTVTDAR